MSSFSSFVKILLLFCGISLVASQECNEVTFTVNVPLTQQDLGSFSLSTGRCQALKFLIPNFKFEVAMSLYFECEDNDLKVSLYEDLDCQQPNGDPYKVDADDEIKLLNGLAKMTIDSLACNKYDCYGEFIYSDNCTSSEALTYFALSFPFGTCLSLTTLENNEKDEEDTRLNGNAVLFHCCKHNKDLLLYNYSSSDCSSSPSVYRFDSKYNGKCFKVLRDDNNNDYSNDNGIGGMFYHLNRRFLQDSNNNNNNNNEHQDGVFLFSYECPENNLVDCSDIDYADDTNFPPQCADTCKEELQSHDNTNIGGDGDDNNGGSGGDSKGSNNHHKSNKGKNITILATLFAGIIVILVIIVAAVFRKNKILKKELNNEQEIVISKEKYKPMIEESGPNIINEQNNTGTGNIANDIVLPTEDIEDDINTQQPIQTDVVTTQDEFE